MSLHKNTGFTALDIGGPMLPVGCTADLNPTDPAVADLVAAGWLTAVQGDPPQTEGTRLVPRQKQRPTAPEEPR